MKRWCMAACAVILLLSPGHIAAQTSFSLSEPDEDALLLCTLNLQENQLSQELEVYVTERGDFLPLGVICGLVECKLQVDPASGTAKGYLWDEAHTFSLDMASRSVSVAGTQAVYDETRVAAYPDDIYVESSLLSEWFGFPIAVDRYTASVALRPQMKLPVQLRLERERRGAVMNLPYGVAERSYYPRTANPYHCVDGLSLDFSVGSSLYSSGDGSSVTFGGPSYSVVLTGDVLWMSGLLSVAGKLDGEDFTPTSFYGVLRRMDPDAMLLGPLHATEISLGNITAVLPSLLGASATGYGAAIGNYSLTSPSYFDLQTISGPLLPGWDVELYRNDNYLDYRKADSSGIYTFADIPLVFGSNVLRLEFHGPLGQAKTEEHVYTVGSSMTPPGTFSYRASATAEDEGGQFAFQTTYGLSKSLTLTASALSGAFADGRNLHAQAGMAGYFNRLQFDASAAYDARHAGFAGDLGLRSQVLGLGLSWRGTYFDQKWEKASASYADPSYLARSALRADGLSWKIGKLSSSAYSSWTSTWYRGGDRYDLVTLQQYNSYKTFRLSNALNLYNFSYSPSSNTINVDGSSTAKARIGGIDFEAACDYGIYPNTAFESLSFSAEGTPFLSIQVNGAVSYSFSSDLLSFAVSLYRDVAPVCWGISGSWTNLNAFSISLTCSTSITLDSKRGAVAVDAQSGARQGSIAARAYLDTNYNRVWDEGEKPLEGVGFTVNDNGDKTLTDAKGNAFIRGLPVNVPVNIAIDESTLEDVVSLLVLPADKGVSCVLHPGTPARLDFPVWIMGEVSGTVWLLKGGVRHELAGAGVELLDESGEVIASTRAAYDGYYCFSALKVGAYTVRIVERNIGDGDTGAAEYVCKAVMILPEGGYVDGIDFEETKQ